ncbi:MAG: hypothetical protein OCD02_07785 [Spirochaetaceae bacterium]
MAIKSAYELAMERASKVTIDKTELKRKELEKTGKEAGSSFLNKPKYNFNKWLEELPEAEKIDSIKGSIWVLIRNINLPNTTADVDKLIKIKEGFLILKPDGPEIEQIFTTLISVYQQYIDNSQKLLEQSKAEFAPKLQQKAMQLAQQTGKVEPIEPETDRDFITFHRGQQEQLDTHYKAYIKQTTEQLEALF